MLRMLGSHRRLQDVLGLCLTRKAVSHGLGQLQNSSRQQQGLLFCCAVLGRYACHVLATHAKTVMKTLVEAILSEIAVGTANYDASAVVLYQLQHEAHELSCQQVA